MAENINIEISLLSVNEVQFMMTLDKVIEDLNPDEIQIGFANKVEPDIATDSISIDFGVRYVLKEKVVLECTYRYTFSVVNLSQFVTVNEDQSMTITHIMPHLLNVAVGTMRGIIVVRTACTPFAKYPLPIIDVNILNDKLSVKQ